jgi:hypothetical protein
MMGLNKNRLVKALHPIKVNRSIEHKYDPRLQDYLAEKIQLFQQLHTTLWNS